MKIGLVRHFKVDNQPRRGRISGENFNAWVEAYDQSDIKFGQFRSSEQAWDVCLSSDLPRAIHTANLIYSGNIIYMEQLREIEIAATWLKGIKLHHFMWLVLGRMAWYYGHSSQSESRTATLLRTQAVIERLERDFGSANVLVVTHGAFMKVLAQQLVQRGYNGKRISHPRNGGLYVYEQGC
ncbi:MULTISPECIES: histidine phosphatase family protein [Paenibacillus]|nr:histidine phosphatase family protein [Paenibacillus odorifer]